MLNKRSEIPFDNNLSPKLIPLIIALMVFLITISLVGAVTIQRFVSIWDGNFLRSYNVRIQPTEKDILIFGGTDVLTEFSVDLLNSFKGVTEISILNEPHTNQVQNDRPPIQIEFKLANGVPNSIENIQDALLSEFNNVIFYQDSSIKRTLYEMGQSILWVALGIAGFIAASAMITIIFATHSGLVIHEKIIDILRLIGAHDRYIAKQFQNHAMHMAVKGGVFGGLFSSIAYFSVLFYAENFSFPVAPQSINSNEIWGIITITPVVMAIMTMLSARLTVMFSLTKQ